MSQPKSDSASVPSPQDLLRGPCILRLRPPGGGYSGRIVDPTVVVLDVGGPPPERKHIPMADIVWIHFANPASPSGPLQDELLVQRGPLPPQEIMRGRVTNQTFTIETETSLKRVTVNTQDIFAIDSLVWA